jgi:hypothetical protein
VARIREKQNSLQISEVFSVSADESFGILLFKDSMSGTEEPKGTGLQHQSLCT